VRIVKKRDSATSILRGIGVKNGDYGLFIKRLDDGRFEVDDAAALRKVSSEWAFAVVDTKNAEIGLTSAGEPHKPVKEKRETISSMAERMILEGKQNHEVWAQLKERFKLGDDKKHYPSWFRSRLRRVGKLPKKEKKP
jgi:hypothetical protein